MHLCKKVEEQQKQVGVSQLYNQVPQTAWVSSSWSWSQLGDRMPAWESACRLRACGPHWPTVEQPQPRWGRSAAMARRTLGQYVAVCPRLQLTSHTQPTSTLSRIKCESYIFIKKCVRSFIEVRHYVWLGLFSLFNGISTFVAYLIPKRYYLTHSWEDEGVHTSPKGICPKVNVIERLEYELAYYDSAVHCFNHYTTRTPPMFDYVLHIFVYVAIQQTIIM